jgi:hypothetical protein
MGPKYKSEGGKWEYAGDPDTKTWHDWRDHSNNQGEDSLKKSLFEYKDGTEENINGGESQHFHYEGNDLPEKE